ncbi:VacJ family lipoprotein [Pelagicoccus sp. SDUM812002]|uniref:MlaA family lipoprotein n=1 Tax=Pelagicoccus sp. SDUM812002 TaxID=3041266 RepID=UPI00280E6C27|nr:VacJ family lipoprotein [Pelagicoccus sp. SDUM812002]MDQ8187509.1 VacJ family lipoprotein [Pelagicoccus sp. SDUM812002]
MKSRRYSGILILATALSATVGAQEDGIDLDDLFNDDFEEQSTVSINDPFEKVNRAIFNFNDGVYDKVARPLARSYSNVMPDRVERGLANAFRNLKFPSRFTGNVLQARFGQAGKETGKFVLNTTVGLGGLFRPSDRFDSLQTSNEDIGQAFGTWGIGHGFYVIIPFMGPTSLRDFVADFGDDAVDPIPTPWSQIDDSQDRLIIRVVDITNRLPALMELYDSMRRSSIDPYSSVRDAYAQRRAREEAR